MRVKNIGRRRFERLLQYHTVLETAIGVEVEWFGDDVQNTIGTIAFNTGARGWNYAVLKRDWAGVFQVCNLRANLYSLAAARVDFLLAMATAQRTDLEIIFQRD